MKFLCDQMLIRLGKWLRAAGYDTLIIENSLSDQEILSIAEKEGRVIITRDNHFLEFREPQTRIVCLTTNSLEKSAEELSARLAIDWLHAPFSRCIDCNHLLREMQSNEAKEEIPEEIYTRFEVFWTCPHCHKKYWLGSHVKEMKIKLSRWNSGHYF